MVTQSTQSVNGYVQQEPRLVHFTLSWSICLRQRDPPTDLRVTHQGHILPPVPAAHPPQTTAQQTVLQQQRIDTFMSELWTSGNRLVALPYRNATTEASRFSKNVPVDKQPQGLRGVGSWVDSAGKK